MGSPDIDSWSEALARVGNCSKPIRLVGSSPESKTSHDLRHDYASVLLAQGESVVAVAERLGHHNASLVLSSTAT